MDVHSAAFALYISGDTSVYSYLPISGFNSGDFEMYNANTAEWTSIYKKLFQ